MEMLGKVRRMFFRDGLSRSEIARRTGLSRNTVKKWLNAAKEAAPKYRRIPRGSKLSPYYEQLRQALEADALRPKRERRTALALLSQLRAQGFDGGYTIVSEFVRAWRQSAGNDRAVRAFVPLRFALGEAFQFDWSEEALVIGGVWRKIQVAHMKLCASRAAVLFAYPSQGHEMLFDAHSRGFAALGGIPRRGIYDNMKTAVDRVKKGKGRVVNARFAALCAHYLFDADFCNVASGWEKGQVEKNVQDSRRRIWLEAGEQRFSSFEQLNAWLLTRCQQLWHEVRHPEYQALSIAEMLEHEHPHLMPLPTLFDGYVEEPGRVTSTCLVSVARNHYSVPCEWAGALVSKRLYPDRIEIIAGDQQIAAHARLFDRSQVRYDWQHYIGLAERKPGVLRNGAPFSDMPAPLLRLQRALLKREGGDRVMSQVLSAVARAGLETVLVAVELVLESGVVSLEHVLNVLARLNQVPVPDKVETLLTVREEPLADTARYDGLREAEVRHA